VDFGVARPIPGCQPACLRVCIIPGAAVHLDAHAAENKAKP
jgi:hypothetical protein